MNYRSPLPRTWTEPDPLASVVTVKATSFSASSLRRTFMSLSATLLPSLPAKGEVLTLMETPIKGSSIFKQAILFSGYPSSIRVCVTLEVGKPETRTISPAYAFYKLTSLRPVFLTILVTLPDSIRLDSWSYTLSSFPIAIYPELILPRAILP